MEFRFADHAVALLAESEIQAHFGAKIGGGVVATHAIGAVAIIAAAAA